jgi:hypothetical protein
MIIELMTESLRPGRGEAIGAEPLSIAIEAGASARLTFPAAPSTFTSMSAGAPIRERALDASSRRSFSAGRAASWPQAAISVAMHSRKGALRMSSSM